MDSIGFGDFIHDATLPYYSAAICTAVLAFLPTVETRWPALTLKYQMSRVSMLPNITPAYAYTNESRQENHSMHLLQADLRRDPLKFRLALSIIALGDKGS
jgi:hypothetical protein